MGNLIEEAELFRVEIRDKINFGKGKLTEIDLYDSKILRADWTNDISLHIHFYSNNIFCVLYKKDTFIMSAHYRKKHRDEFFNMVQSLANEADSGKYDRHITYDDKIRAEIGRRGLVSCMNNTKWREFVYAMENEMPFPPPYEYKTLFENGEYTDAADIDESRIGDYGDDIGLNWHDFKSIEWVKVKPRHYDNEGGRLYEKRKYHYAEKEFEELMKEYSIPYEEENGVYTIYGYK